MERVETEPQPQPQPHQLSKSYRWAFKPTITYKQQSAEEWLSEYRSLLPTPINDVETLWKVLEAVPSFENLDSGNIYSLFREGVTASWEDPANEHGFSVVLYMNKHLSPEWLSKLYRNALFVTAGNACSFSNNLNGCTFERKSSGNKIAFWFAHTLALAEQQSVAEEVMQQLQVDRRDFLFGAEEDRIEWRESRLANIKVVVKCLLHKQRASIDPRKTSTSATTSDSRRRKPAHQVYQVYQQSQSQSQKSTRK